MGLDVLTITSVAVWIFIFILAVVALYIIFYSLKNLNNGIIEIVKGNTAIALLAVSVFVIIGQVIRSWVNLFFEDGAGFGDLIAIASIFQLIFGIVLAVAAIYLTLNIFNKLTKRITKGIDVLEELKKGNLAVAILMAGIVLTIARGDINAGVYMSLDFLIISVPIWIVYLVIGVVCEVVTLYIIFYSLKKLTSGKIEIVKVNTAIALLVVSVFVTIWPVVLGEVDLVLEGVKIGQVFDLVLGGGAGVEDIIAIVASTLKLILGIVLAVAAVYLALKIFNKLTERIAKGIDVFEELKNGNLAVAILMAVIVLSIADAVQLFLNVLFDFDAKDVKNVIAIAAIFRSMLRIVLVVAVFYLALNIFNKLTKRSTKGIDVFEELKNGNLAVAILIGVIVLSIAKVVPISYLIQSYVMGFYGIADIFKLILGLLLAVAAIYFTLNIFNKLAKQSTKGIGTFEELKKGNLAVAILMTGIVISVANLIQFYRIDFYGIDIASRETVQVIVQVIDIILALVALYIGFYSLKKLTTGILEEKEIVKGNIAIALLVASVLVTIGNVIRVKGPFQLTLGIVLVVAASYFTLNVFNNLTKRITKGISAFEELKKGNLAVAILTAGTVLLIANFIQVDLIIAIYKLFFDAKDVKNAIAITNIFKSILGIVLAVATIYLVLRIFNKLIKQITKGIGAFEELKKGNLASKAQLAEGGKMRNEMNNTVFDIEQKKYEEEKNEELSQFRVVNNLWLQLLIAKLPYVLAFLLLLDWLIGPGIFARDTFRLTAVITAIIELLLFNALFDKVRYSLSTIRKRGIISQSSETQKVFKDFIQKFGAALNNKIAQFILGIIFSVIGFINTFPIRCLMSDGYSCYSNSSLFDWMFLHFFIRGTILEIPFAFLIGLLAWRLIVIAFFIYRLGKDFTLNILTYHNDGSGGLKPLGDLCLTIAVIILLPIILLSGWIVVGPLPGYETINILWSDWFKILLLGFCLGAALFFFWPLYSIHEQMKEHRLKIQNELDELNSKMSEILTNLRTKADTNAPDEGTKLLEKLEFMGKIHQKSSSVPTWPFNLNIIVKFIAAEAVPILSLIGVTGPLVKILESLFSLLA